MLGQKITHCLSPALVVTKWFIGVSEIKVATDHIRSNDIVKCPVIGQQSII